MRPADWTTLGMASAFAVWGWAGTLSLARVPGTPLRNPVEMMRTTPRLSDGGYDCGSDVPRAFFLTERIAWEYVDAQARRASNLGNYGH